MRNTVVTRAMREQKDLRDVREGRVKYPRTFGTHKVPSPRLVNGGEFVRDIPRELNPLINAIAKGDKPVSSRYIEAAYKAGQDVHTITDAIIEGVRRWPRQGKERG